MILSFALSKNRRANVWLDEPPPAGFTASSTVAEIVRPNVVVSTSRRTAGVEISIPHGPKASYALLGAELVESEVDGLEVVVAVNSVGSPFAPSLALKPDEVKVGLPAEFADAVVAGIESIAASLGCPTKSVLRFRWAAHALAGSSPSIFAEASGLVMQLLMLPQSAPESDIASLFG